MDVLTLLRETLGARAGKGGRPVYPCAELLNSFDAAIREEWSTTNRKDWANESFQIAEAASTRSFAQADCLRTYWSGRSVKR